MPPTPPKHEPTRAGCGDPSALNFVADYAAATHFAACVYAPLLVCADSAARNYAPLASLAASLAAGRVAVAAPWLCEYAVYGCADPTADNYNSVADAPWHAMCMYPGCAAYAPPSSAPQQLHAPIATPPVSFLPAILRPFLTPLLRRPQVHRPRRQVL